MLPDVSSVEQYIRQAAKARGIDPDIAVRVAKSEGLAPGVWQSNVVKDGRRETSYGPFQLLVGGGLGDKFKAKYGASPNDPSTWQKQIEFALDEAKAGGWGPWYGAAKVGIGPRMGLDGASAVTDRYSAPPEGLLAAARPEGAQAARGGPAGLLAGLGAQLEPDADIAGLLPLMGGGQDRPMPMMQPPPIQYPGAPPPRRPVDTRRLAALANRPRFGGAF